MSRTRAHSALRLILIGLLLSVSLPLAQALECKPSVSDDTSGTLHYDLTSLLDHEVTTSKTSETPPTKNIAKLRMMVCGDQGLKKDPDLSDEDQCPEGTVACLTLMNEKESSSEPSRVTAVIPIWPKDIPAQDVKSVYDREGAKFEVSGPEYAGVKQHMSLIIECSQEDGPAEPEIDSYSDGKLILRWSSPQACPVAGEGDGNASDEGGGSSGIGGFFKAVFWLIVIGLVLYFAGGMYYNYSTYGARGTDLLPHKDFWMDVPSMCQNLFSHLGSSVRGEGSGASRSRAGYTSLG